MSSDSRQIVLDFAAAYRDHLIERVRILVPDTDIDVLLPNPIDTSPLVQEWLTLAAAADGQLAPTAGHRFRVRDAFERLAMLLFSVPGDTPVRHPPLTWAKTPMADVVWRAIVWALADDLITIVEAADLVGVTIQAVSQKTPALRFYIDPTAAQRQGRRLVNRSEVLAIDWATKKPPHRPPS